jgi:hypothetical protein
MLSARGLYEWKLVDVKTNKIILQGEKWNLVTDRFLWIMGNNQYALNNSSNSKLAIVLSATEPGVDVGVPAVDLYDYREYGISHNKFTLLATGTFQPASTGYIDYVLNSKWTDNNFAPPGSPRTIRIIGVAYTNTTTPNSFVSFIELDTPVTQNTDQYFYVKYTIFFNFSSNGGNVPNNRFIQFHMNKNLLYGTPLYFGYTGNTSYRTKRHVTILVEPTVLDNVMRHVPSVFGTAYTDGGTVIGCRMATRIEKSFLVADIPGPVGCICHSESLFATLGYSPAGLSPSVSRVFIHPSNRLSQIFSDPAYPPSSNGNVVITGTPTNTAPIVGRIKITKTGDGSNIVDEVVAYTDVDVDNDWLLVTQGSLWATNDILKIDNDENNPPEPLVEGTNYYVIYVDGTYIKLSTIKDGPAIDITSQGTGNNTLTRQNTGTFSLELEPYGLETVLSQLPMGIDFDNKVQPANLTSLTDTGEGGIIWTTDCSYLVRGLFQYNDYIYSVQKSRVSFELTICSWKFWTIESSVSLCKFGTSSTKYRAMVKSGDAAYIATNEGIYKYDITTPTVAPILITVTNIIDTNITELAIDEITGHLWTGHTTGLSKIDLGTLIAVQYITGGGEQLEGMISSDVYINPGQITAYDGRIIRVGMFPLGGSSKAWILQDGVGWCYVNNNVSRSGTLRKGTNEVVVFSNLSPYTIIRYSVVVTGKNSGTVTVLQSYASTSSSDSVVSSRIRNQMVQMSDSKFIFDNVTGGAFDQLINTLIYEIDVGITTMYSTDLLQFDPIKNLSVEELAWRYSLNKNLIDFGNAVNVAIPWDLKITTPGLLGSPYSYGTNGATWIKDYFEYNLNILQVGTYELLHGLFVGFNNATGKPWDQQFIEGERFTFMYGATKFKDNLQTMQLKARTYYSEVSYASAIPVTVPVSAAYTYHVTEAIDPNFREVDNYSLVVSVKDGLVAYTALTLPTGNTFTAAYTTDLITVGINIATGTVVYITTTGTLPLPLRYNGVYYAINVSPTQIKLALTYADAIGNVPIDLIDNGLLIHTIYQIVPATTQYFLGLNGIFVFAAADAGKNLTLDYTTTYYS